MRDFGARGIHDRNEGGTAQGKRIIAMRVVSNGSCGICLGGDGNVVRDCLVADNKGTGACVGRSIVERGIFLNNTTGGIACGDYSQVVGNLVSKTEKTGVFARTGCTITDKTVCEAGNTGIYGEHGCVIQRNITGQNNQSDTPSGYAGIKAVGDCIIRGNVARGNLQNNIYVLRSGNVVEDNLATAPSDTLGNGYCFRVGSSYFANNKASDNETDFAGELPVVRAVLASSRPASGGRPRTSPRQPHRRPKSCSKKRRPLCRGPRPRSEEIAMAHDDQGKRGCVRPEVSLGRPV